jgi:hypothetical protein
MNRRSIPLVERLSHGLASAVLSAAALAVPSVEAASPDKPGLTQSPGGASRLAAPGKATKTPKTSGPRRFTSPVAKPAAGGEAQAPGGCGASDGGCGPSR